MRKFKTDLAIYVAINFFFFFSSRRRHTRLVSDWSSDVCSSDLSQAGRRSRRAYLQSLPRPRSRGAAGGAPSFARAAPGGKRRRGRRGGVPLRLDAPFRLARRFRGTAVEGSRGTDRRRAACEALDRRLQRLVPDFEVGSNEGVNFRHEAQVQSRSSEINRRRNEENFHLRRY